MKIKAANDTINQMLREKALGWIDSKELVGRLWTLQCFADDMFEISTTEEEKEEWLELINFISNKSTELQGLHKEPTSF